MPDDTIDRMQLTAEANKSTTSSELPCPEPDCKLGLEMNLTRNCSSEAPDCCRRAIFACRRGAVRGRSLRFETRNEAL